MSSEAVQQLDLRSVRGFTEAVYWIRNHVLEIVICGQLPLQGANPKQQAEELDRVIKLRKNQTAVQYAQAGVIG